MFIKIIDDMTPEDVAMLQALYSRSQESVLHHLGRVRSRGSEQFHKKYYVGYGHKSIGDCGDTAIFIENVPMIVAKAIQQWPLYNGQEKSTRYLDFSVQPFANPLKTEAADELGAMLRKFYMGSRESLREHLVKTYPQKPGEKDEVYNRAIDARVFDILRGFLPAGAHTSLSWKTNLRQAADHLRGLCTHPDPLVAATGQGIRAALEYRYPSSFKRQTQKVIEREEAIDEWTRKVQKSRYDAAINYNGSIPFDIVFPDTLRFDQFGICEGVCEILKDRPKGAEVPHDCLFGEIIQTWMTIDYGSYRDLQRHRNGSISVPYLNRANGFHPWYLEQLPSNLRRKAEDLLEQHTQKQIRNCITAQFPSNHPYQQYYIPMGYMVDVRVRQNFPAWVYRVELRSSKMVHPTLRQIVHKEIEAFKSETEMGQMFALHADLDPDDWDVRRGTQTIEKIEESG